MRAPAGMGTGAPVLPWQQLLLLHYLLSFSAILEVNGNLNCRCVKTTLDYISPKRYESIEIRPVGMLRVARKVCVNPDAPWVKKLLKRIAST
uniref:Chemokine interleukin-8-like domain-containing protein n=1 Tax=Accipiter nisus TaxID=211598 RepID=A0A8B9MEW7_9AVES